MKKLVERHSEEFLRFSLQDEQINIWSSSHIYFLGYEGEPMGDYEIDEDNIKDVKVIEKDIIVGLQNLVSVNSGTQTDAYSFQKASTRMEIFSIQDSLCFCSFNAFIKELNLYELSDGDQLEELKEVDIIDEFEALEVVSIAESDYSIVPSKRAPLPLIPEAVPSASFNIFRNPCSLGPGSIFMDNSVLKQETIYDGGPVKNKTRFSELPKSMPKGNMPVTFHK